MSTPLILLIYCVIAVIALLAALSWRVTGKADTAFSLPAEKKAGMAFPVIMLVTIGIPLFASGLGCTFYCGGSALEAYITQPGNQSLDFSLVGLMIAVPTLLTGHFVCRFFWRWMRKNLE